MTFANVFLTGASSGLGRGLALHYAREGSTVVACARRKVELDSLVAEAAAAGSTGRIVPRLLDVADAEAVVAAVAEAEEQAGGALDLVIANAGVGGPTNVLKMDWRKVKQIMDVNVTGACVTLCAAIPKMVEARRGSLVAVASLAGLRGLPGTAAYCASKSAVHIFMESLRVDLRSTGVKATCIYPGFVKTEMTAKNKFKMPFLMELEDATRVMAKGIAKGAPTIAYPLPLVAGIRAVAALPRFLYEPLASRAMPQRSPKRLSGE